MKSKKILLTTITLISLAYQTLNASELTQKEKGVNLLEKAFSTKQDRSVLNFINKDKYIQHNLYAKDGIAGLEGYLNYLNGKKLAYKVAIAFEDNNHVVTLSSSSQEQQISEVIDIFRFEKGLIVEHWDNAQALKKADTLKSLKTVDLDKTSENKKLIKEMIDKEVLEGKYLKNHKILGQGNFVLAINEIKKDDKRISLYELFNIKNSKIINTWKIEEVIPAISQWQNVNGKF